MRRTNRPRFYILGARLRERRESLGMTLRQLSKKTGFPAPWLSEIERAQRYPDLFDYARVTRALGMPKKQAFEWVHTLSTDKRLQGKPDAAPKSRHLVDAAPAPTPAKGAGQAASKPVTRGAR